MVRIEVMVRRSTVALGILVAMSAESGTIYGKLIRDGKPLSNANFLLTCQQVTTAGQSGHGGTYSASIAAVGGCHFSVDNKSSAVFLRSEPARYDFEVPAFGMTLVQY